MNFLLIHKHHQEIHRKCLTTRRFGQPRTIPTSSAKEAVKSTWTLLTHPLSGGRTILYLEAEKYNIMKTCLGHFFLVFTLCLTRIMQSWRSALIIIKKTWKRIKVLFPDCSWNTPDIGLLKEPFDVSKININVDVVSDLYCWSIIPQNHSEVCL